MRGGDDVKTFQRCLCICVGVSVCVCAFYIEFDFDQKKERVMELTGVQRGSCPSLRDFYFVWVCLL